jgi:hypothetical protein
VRLLPSALLAVAAALVAPAARAGDDSLRCDGGLVSLGDTKLDLLGKCGEPTLRDAHQVQRSVASVRDGERRLERSEVAYAVERWTYDLGKNRFAYSVTLALGKVTAIERGGYGYAEPGARAPVKLRRARCDAYAVREGDTALDVLARCGEPALREEEEVARAWGEGPDGAAAARAEVVELWTYDFGPQALVRRLRIEGGTVVRIETGGRGYAE